ncbi:Hypothetical protein NTJ_04092 [Nesidiocoris tenuis]|uniref:Uncharacterized protein n=1 Tax=Nesidiocoris tenuis TaxID=355587 RepID=A0ABN7AH43_9HEMI|nr:Hypothetical protein NTJ_04092 [Nesidiocoris tenuis]
MTGFVPQLRATAVNGDNKRDGGGGGGGGGNVNWEEIARGPNGRSANPQRRRRSAIRRPHAVHRHRATAKSMQQIFTKRAALCKEIIFTTSVTGSPRAPSSKATQLSRSGGVKPHLLRKTKRSLCHARQNRPRISRDELAVNL